MGKVNGFWRILSMEDSRRALKGRENPVMDYLKLHESFKTTLFLKEHLK
jgi:hypothetical protein